MDEKMIGTQRKGHVYNRRGTRDIAPKLEERKLPKNIEDRISNLEAKVYLDRYKKKFEMAKSTKKNLTDEINTYVEEQKQYMTGDVFYDQIQELIENKTKEKESAEKEEQTYENLMKAKATEIKQEIVSNIKSELSDIQNKGREISDKIKNMELKRHEEMKKFHDVKDIEELDKQLEEFNSEFDSLKQKAQELNKELNEAEKITDIDGIKIEKQSIQEKPIIPPVQSGARVKNPTRQATIQPGARVKNPTRQATIQPGAKFKYFNVKRDKKGITINGKFMSYEQIERENEKLDEAKAIPAAILDFEARDGVDIELDKKITYAVTAFKAENPEFDLEGFLEEYEKLIKDDRDENGKKTTKMDLTYDLKNKFIILKKDERKKFKELRESAYSARKYAKLEMRGITKLKLNSRAHREEVKKRLEYLPMPKEGEGYKEKKTDNKAEENRNNKKKISKRESFLKSLRPKKGEKSEKDLKTEEEAKAKAEAIKAAVEKKMQEGSKEER